MITHRGLNLNEYWGFDDQNKMIYIYFDKSLDPININTKLKNEIIKFGRKYNINIFHDEKAFRDFLYLDLILSNLENSTSQLEKEDEEKIVESRDRLGIIVNEENLFQLLYDFSEEISQLLKKKFPEI